MATSRHVDVSPPPPPPQPPKTASHRRHRHSAAPPPDLRRPARKYYTRLQSKLSRSRKAHQAGNMVLVLVQPPTAAAVAATPPIEFPTPLVLAPGSRDDAAKTGDRNFRSNKARIFGGIEKKMRISMFRGKQKSSNSACAAGDASHIHGNCCIDDYCSNSKDGTSTSGYGWLTAADKKSSMVPDYDAMKPGECMIPAAVGRRTKASEDQESVLIRSRRVSADSGRSRRMSGEQHHAVANRRASSFEAMVTTNNSSTNEADATLNDNETAEMTAAMAALELELEVDVECECCGMVEECTSGYVERTKGDMGGHWLCGLCETAVHEELARSRRLDGGLHAAIQAHMLPCRQFRRRRRPSSSADVPDALCRLLRRHLSSPAPRRRSASFSRSASSLN